MELTAQFAHIEAWRIEQAFARCNLHVADPHLCSSHHREAQLVSLQECESSHVDAVLLPDCLVNLFAGQSICKSATLGEERFK